MPFCFIKYFNFDNKYYNINRMLTRFSNSIFILFSLLYITSNTVVLFDSEFQSQHFTDPDTNSWTITGSGLPSSHFQYSCNGNLLFGGYDIFAGDNNTNPSSISKTFPNLPPHWSVRIQTTIYKIDAWDNQELYVIVDGAISQTYNWSQSFGGSDICGNPYPIIDSVNQFYNDGSVAMDINITHQASTLTIEFTSNLANQQNQYWGIRNFNLYLALCDPSCLTCNSSSNCLTCPTITNLTSTSLGGGLYSCTCSSGLTQLDSNCMNPTCILCNATCSGSYYASGSNCVSCTSGCNVCTGAGTSSAVCTGCAINYYYNLSNSANVCLNCDPSCKTCSGPLSTDCLSCASLLFLSGSTCLSSCLSGFYGVQTSNSCNSCSANCLTCFNSLATSCLTCNTPYYFIFSNNSCSSACSAIHYIYSNTCYQQCPATTYQVSSNMTCQPCISNCIHCIDSTTCSQCASSYQYASGSCITSCPTGTYYQSSNQTCSICYSLCTACTNYTQDSCTNCISGLNLVNNTCSNQCPSSFYQDLTNGNCIACDPTCLTCVNSTNIGCITCVSGLFYDINNTQCIPSCNSNLQAISIENLQCWTCYSQLQKPYLDNCFKCHPSCSLCYGETFENCVSCAANRSAAPTYGICLCNQNFPYELIDSCSSTQNPLNLIDKVIKYCLIINLIAAVVLELIFKNPTNLFFGLEIFQILSFTYYFSIPYPYSMNSIYQILLKTHFTTSITPLFTFFDQMPITRSTGKFGIQKFYSYLIYDIQIIVLGYIGWLLLIAIFKIVRSFNQNGTPIYNALRWLQQRCEVFLRLWFRLTLIQLTAAVCQNIKYFSWDDKHDIYCLYLVIVPLILFVVTIMVKKWIKETKSEEYYLPYSIEYEYGDPTKQKEKQDEILSSANKVNMQDTQMNQQAKIIQSNQINNTKEEFIFDDMTQSKIPELQKSKSRTSNQQSSPKDKYKQPQNKSNKSIKSAYTLPIFLQFIKVILAATTVLIAGYAQGQTIMNLVFSCMLALMMFFGKYKRKIYKLNSKVVGVFFVLTGLFFVFMTFINIKTFGVFISYLWLILMLYLLVLTLLQFITNILVIPQLIGIIPQKIERYLNEHVQEDESNNNNDDKSLSNQDNKSNKDEDNKSNKANVEDLKQIS